LSAVKFDFKERKLDVPFMKGLPMPYREAQRSLGKVFTRQKLNH